ncbi:hypothetical protein NDI56_05710 [Haloarcula sp. S1CR25-12]|uniref:Lipoprotein n=1 Tax=Haloarcula saliterrae TaxID=2950534 RepID=A0ABU2FAP0_9EURY|nr:hypothetical protein [Haloarcula sp. S1CR25-12]MDS0258886.1 hypothetical protein [Haloarcula sp. S1CR25-12]
MDTPTRRAVLAGGAALASSFAGCSGLGGGSSAPTDGAPVPTEASELDLREANVTAVTVEDAGEREYRFDVTLYHDDDGEDGYANWWQVETLSGEPLGRRDLSHPHSTEPVTRSTTAGVPGGVSCVVVRGHDQTHGYGGQAMAVALGDGATEPLQQGPDRRAVDESDCP